jgi:hypothetical protein
MQFFCLFRFFLFFFIFISGVISQVQADDLDYPYIRVLEQRITLAEEDLFQKVSQLIMEKYCPNEYQDILTKYYPHRQETDSHFTLPEIIETHNPRVRASFQACENYKKVVILSDGFNRNISELSATILKQGSSAVMNENPELSENEKNEFADLIVNARIESSFISDAVLRALEEQLLQSSTQLSKDRCHVCNTKLGLIPFECKCGGFFCKAHRYNDQHPCSFDFRAAGRREVAKKNPLVVRDKLENRI